MKLVKIVSIVVLFAAAAFGQVKPVLEGSENFWDLKSLPAPQVRLEGALWGFDGGNILAIGGFKGDQGSQEENLDIYALLAGQQVWQVVGKIDSPLFYGTTVSTSGGVVCIGGVSGENISTRVTQYRLSGTTVQSVNLRELPMQIASPKAAVMSGHIYVAGLDGSDEGKSVFIRLDLLSENAQWQSIDVWPGEARVDMAVVAIGDNFYLFGGDSYSSEGSLSDAYQYTHNKGWRELAELPFSVTSAFAVSCGESHILFAGMGDSPNQIIGYHTISNRYLNFVTIEESAQPMAFVGAGASFYYVTPEKITFGRAILPGTKYGWADHSVVAIFMISLLCVGGLFARQKRSTDDYFRGGRHVPWWASGLSLFANGASAISLMAMPGKAFATNWVYVSTSFYIILISLPLSLLVYIPIARRLRVATANEYLERRYNLFMRLFAGIIWSTFQIVGRVSAIMLLPAIAISSIVGMPIETSILIMGFVATTYAFLGGLKSVIWTDVLQAVVMIGAVIICALWAIFSLNMDAADAAQTIRVNEKLYMFDWGIDIARTTVLVMFLNVVVTLLGQIGDQNFIQRVQCTSSEREARKALITSLGVAVPLNLLLFSLGTILFLFYKERPEMLSPATKSDGVFPLFAAQNLPAGLAGLVIAAIFAATMSTLSGALNSAANIGTEDFYRRLFKGATDRKCLILGKLLTLGLGIFGTGMALILANTKLMSIWDLFITIAGMLTGAIAGVFAMGIFTKKANSAGAIIGAFSSLLTTFYIQKYTHISFFMYPVFGVLSCIVIGYIASLLIPIRRKNLEGLTVYTLGARDND